MAYRYSEALENGLSTEEVNILLHIERYLTFSTSTELLNGHCLCIVMNWWDAARRTAADSGGFRSACVYMCVCVGLWAVQQLS